MGVRERQILAMIFVLMGRLLESGGVPDDGRKKEEQR
ncbi:hypothetical protein JonanDRAFT_0914 [Jonquetella anthropi DSM 22815]|uniref:Uncharacterized protein n=1 Tax=Jonquetella anthropi DSM 22815 TaxID=885272 RepID=H0UKS8_9BACT|nr:hypothetical protein JonanDRAFT_0914 [Jonquetella anthropi DSM 22815]